MMRPVKFISRCVLFVVSCTVVFLTACAAMINSTPAGKPEYEVTSVRPSSQVTASNEGNQAVIEVYSDSGIGDASVRLVSGAWPKSIVMRFHLQGLENMKFSYGETIVNLSVNTENMVLESIIAPDGTEEEIDEESVYWMPVTFLDEAGTAVDRLAAGGVLEVNAPASFLAGNYAQFTINWIDFYR
ncbi:MAG: hypothetical protein ACK2UF_06740 [Candidatus Promineifilaceae bacterium]